MIFALLNDSRHGVATDLHDSVAVTFVRVFVYEPAGVDARHLRAVQSLDLGEVSFGDDTAILGQADEMLEDGVLVEREHFETYKRGMP